MKVTATSSFHGNLSVSFIGLKEGKNIRRLQGGKSNYCLETHGCMCGYPISRTDWELSDPEFVVGFVCEKGHPESLGADYGRGWIEINIHPKQ